MKRFETGLRACVAMVLAVVLLLTALPAMAAGDLQILVAWGDNGESTLAVPVGQDGVSYWAQIPGEALGSPVRIQLADPTGQIASWSTDQATMLSGSELQLDMAVDAGAQINTDLAIALTACDAGGNPLAVIYLYLSTWEPPVEEPEPQPQAQPVDVTVIHRDEMGQELSRQVYALEPGSAQTFYANAMEGYTPVDYAPREVTVQVDAQGNATQTEVVFVLRQLPSSAMVTVSCLAEDGSVIYQRNEEIPSGETRVFTAQQFSGYVLAEGQPGEVTVSVDGGGNATVNAVTFMYRALPASAAVQVVHRAEAGTLLGEESYTIATGDSQTVSAASYQGYALAEGQPGEVLVTVDGQGVISQGTVTFVYRALPSSAAVQVVYQAQDGTVLGQESLAIATGSSQTVPAKEFQGYALAEGQPSEVLVTVDGQGVISPNSVTFYYRALPASAAVQVVYQTEDGTVLGYESVSIGAGSSQTVYAKEYPGYALVDYQPGEVLVTVDGQGVISQGTVTFYYRALPASAAVQVVHRAEDGTVLGQETVSIATGSSQTISARSFQGYALAEGQPGEVSVTVDGSGSPSHDQVTFVYRALPGSAAIVVIYQTEEGEELQRQVVDVASNSQETIRIQPLEGYSLMYSIPAEPSITVSAEGVPSMQEVIFVLRKNITSVDVPVRAVTADGQVLSEKTVNVGCGLSQTVFAESIQGYRLEENQAGEAVVTVDAAGLASPEAIQFIYERIPESASLTVRYVSGEDGSEVARETLQLNGNETHTVTARIPEGYLFSANQAESVQVAVDMDGTPDPAEVVFYVQLPPPVDGQVTIRYRSVGGNDLVEPFGMTIPGNTSLTLTPDAGLLPEGFDADTAEPAQVTVTVSRDGTASPAEVSFTFRRLISVEETPIPVGQIVDRWAVTNGKGVNLRKTASENASRVKQISKSGTYVWVIEEEMDSKGRAWSKVVFEGKSGYIMSKFLNVLSQAESDDYQETLANPMATTEPRAEVPAEVITPAPVTEAPVTPPPVTEAPVTQAPVTPAPVTQAPATQVPVTPTVPVMVVTPAPAQYAGYAMASQDVVLFQGINGGASPVKVLTAGTLVIVEKQYYDEYGQAWSSVADLDGNLGYVQDEALTRLNAAQAQPYLEAHEREQQASAPTPVPTAEPAQWQGYAVSIGDNVMLRQAPNDRSIILNVLKQETIVYVDGQVYDTEDGWPWHHVFLEGAWGYVRSDMLRVMTDRELDAYLNASEPAPQPQVVVTPQMNSMDMLSSYGYIYSKNGGIVNMRRTSSTGSDVVGKLRQYAMCLVLGTKNVNGETWYWVEYNGVQGYVKGDFFRHLTMGEFEEFLQSQEYVQGLRNNSGNTGSKTTVTAAPVVSVEQQNAQTWSDPESSGNVAYATWVPMATVAPYVSPTPAPQAVTAPTDLPVQNVEVIPLETESPVVGIVTETIPTPEASEGPVPIGTTVPVTQKNDGGSPLGWVLLGLLGVGAAGGGYIYYLHSRNRKLAAQRAAQRRTQAQSAADAAAARQPQASPYARQTGSAGQTGQSRAQTGSAQGRPQQRTGQGQSRPQQPAGSPQGQPRQPGASPAQPTRAGYSGQPAQSAGYQSPVNSYQPPVSAASWGPAAASAAGAAAPQSAPASQPKDQTAQPQSQASATPWAPASPSAPAGGTAYTGAGSFQPKGQEPASVWAQPGTASSAVPDTQSQLRQEASSIVDQAMADLDPQGQGTRRRSRRAGRSQDSSDPDSSL